MAQATTSQYRTAIENYRRHAADARIQSSREVEGSWQQAADLRNAAKFDAKADELEDLMMLKSEQAVRIAQQF